MLLSLFPAFAEKGQFVSTFISARRFRSVFVAALFLPPLILGISACGSVQDVVDGAQSAVSDTGELAKACQSAEAAWAADATPEQATAALEEASATVTAIVDAGTIIPGVDTLNDAINTALETIATDPTGATLQAVTTAVESACSVFNAVSQ